MCVPFSTDMDDFMVFSSGLVLTAGSKAKWFDLYGVLADASHYEIWVRTTVSQWLFRLTYKNYQRLTSRIDSRVESNHSRVVSVVKAWGNIGGGPHEEGSRCGSAGAAGVSLGKASYDSFLSFET
ncbi:hypothetical protein L7F22_006132 [Adiantum nelumboides]|nr:hypothetical protein [Adiantum nelumboides]